MSLASLYGTVKNHNGAIPLSSAEEQGTTLTICLPWEKEIVLNVTSEALKESGFEVVKFLKSSAAITYFKDHFKNIDLAILDMIIPEMDGKETLFKLGGICPSVKV